MDRVSGVQHRARPPRGRTHPGAARQARSGPLARRAARAPLARAPEYYDKARLGYARGGMRSRSSTAVRAYYDIMLRNEAPPSRACMPRRRRRDHDGDRAHRPFAALTLAAAPHARLPGVCADDHTGPSFATASPRVRARHVPVGGSEQNGPTQVLGKHNARARVLAERVALAGRHVVAGRRLAPEGSLVPPTAHMRFPGTVTVPTAAFEATLESRAKATSSPAPRRRVRRRSGGYQSSLQAVAQRLNRAWAKTPVRAHAIVQYYRAPRAISRRRCVRAVTATKEIGTHARSGRHLACARRRRRVVRPDKLARAARPPTAPTAIRGARRRARRARRQRDRRSHR